MKFMQVNLSLVRNLIVMKLYILNAHTIFNSIYAIVLVFISYTRVLPIQNIISTLELLFLKTMQIQNCAFISILFLIKRLIIGVALVSILIVYRALLKIQYNSVYENFYVPASK